MASPETDDTSKANKSASFVNADDLGIRGYLNQLSWQQQRPVAKESCSSLNGNALISTKGSPCCLTPKTVKIAKFRFHHLQSESCSISQLWAQKAKCLMLTSDILLTLQPP